MYKSSAIKALTNKLNKSFIIPIFYSKLFLVINLFFNFDVQMYKEYLEPPNKYITFFKKNHII